MSRKLFLIRHAQAEEAVSGIKDKDRDLTSGGYQQASKLGYYLNNLRIPFHYALVSSAKRCQQTFERINEQLNIAEEDVLYSDDIYEASVRTLLHEICQVDVEIKNLIVICHNPSITYLAEYLSSDDVGNVSPADIVELAFEGSSWEMLSENTAVFVQKIEIENL